MKEKSLAILICTLIALSILGFAYAQWNDTITITNTMTFGTENMGFVEPLICIEYHEDPQTGQLVPGEYLSKEVGNCEYEYQEIKTDIETGKQGYDKLKIILNNAYPDYIVHINFTLEDIGSLPIHIKELVISDPDGVLTWDPNKNALVNSAGDPVISIVFNPDPVCTILQPTDDPNTPVPDNKAAFEMSIRTTQNAKECQTYSFKVEIHYEVIP